MSLQGKTIFSASLDGGGGDGGGGDSNIFWSGWSTEPTFNDLPLGTVTSDGVSNLEISDRTVLTSFNSYYTYSGGTIDASNCTSLNDLMVGGQNLTDVNVSGCTSLTIMTVASNSLTGAFDASGLTSLNSLYVDWNSGLTSLDISDTPLVLLNIQGLPNLTTITLNNVTTLNYVYVFGTGTDNLSNTTKEALLASCVAAYNSGNAGYGYIDFVGDSSLLSAQGQADLLTLQNAGWTAS